ncbi:class I SAM-dependent methyltransferase [Streptomyces piniterrae]|uniref:Class I SAM-dependent methyltransferase n=1 Tax=Streptomyces piniterrae TaxID=2571125 RepID=A0A4U0NVY9_9ACTN|nr:class I SAM-dependent methyltransferase [Streptomyces piniterrae]TJZ58863.1 class I SAM-dependent methyltransferase [Streptomyces piniterrae]
MGLSMATAARWVERWEGQQQRYAIDRQERFTVIADVVEHMTVGHSTPLVVDLGCGPGALAAELAHRLPAAEILAVDADPLLLELGRTHYGSTVRYVETVIGEPGWLKALALHRPLDAAVSTTALHYLCTKTLRRVYRQLAALLRPGGVLVNGDHLCQDAPTIAEIAGVVGRRRAERQHAFAHEDWDSWWSAAAADQELADLLTERRSRRLPSSEENDLTLSAHVALLHEAGFRHVGPVWQFGNSQVLVAVR